MVAMQEIPDTRGGRILRRIMAAVLIASIIGIADQLRTLFWIVMTGEGRNPARVSLMLIGFLLLCWTGYKAYRQNVVPPLWLVACIPVLTSIYLLWPA